MTTTLVQAEIAANRFGLGAGPGELAEIAKDPQGWVLAQIDEAERAPLIEPLAALPSTITYLERFDRFRRDHAAARRRMSEAAANDKPTQSLPTLLERFGAMKQAEIQARGRQQCLSPFPVLERWVMFWSNHFTVSADRGGVQLLPGAFEREAIRPYVSSSFSAMLLGVEQHPAMLLYLDNAASVGPDSPLARSARASAGRLGLNENLAREILELHTLGVDGPYQQQDVVELARAITGWRTRLELPPSTEAPALGPYGSLFHGAAHQGGERELLGRRFAAGGARQGRDMLRFVAGQEATATFVATKLARHFVADDPPGELVSALASTFQRENGRLSALFRTLFSHPQAWQPQALKFRRPQEYLVALYRALGKAPSPDGSDWGQQLRLLGQPPFLAGAPAGWSDDANDWIGADALNKRLLVAQRHAGDASGEAMELAQQSLGPRLREATAVALSQAPRNQALAMVLASPEFQWR
ncbi:DUF1800 domain-containing protein [Halomonas sp. SCS19]|uniref:DUF1800 domain-containing protein n=1 Tax=Halomonas sp. SCS19 TaxID=2950870 RepID=UPI0032DF8598